MTTINSPFQPLLPAPWAHCQPRAARTLPRPLVHLARSEAKLQLLTPLGGPEPGPTFAPSSSATSSCPFSAPFFFSAPFNPHFCSAHPTLPAFPPFLLTPPSFPPLFLPPSPKSLIFCPKLAAPPRPSAGTSTAVASSASPLSQRGLSRPCHRRGASIQSCCCLTGFLFIFLGNRVMGKAGSGLGSRAKRMPCLPPLPVVCSPAGTGS